MDINVPRWDASREKEFAPLTTDILRWRDINDYRVELGYKPPKLTKATVAADPLPSVPMATFAPPIVIKPTTPAWECPF